MNKKETQKQIDSTQKMIDDGKKLYDRIKNFKATIPPLKQLVYTDSEGRIMLCCYDGVCMIDVESAEGRMSVPAWMLDFEKQDVVLLGEL